MVSPGLVGSGNTGAVGSITSDSRASTSSVTFNSNRGGGTMNTLRTETIGTTATGVTSLGRNHPGGRNPTGTSASSSAITAVAGSTRYK